MVTFQIWVVELFARADTVRAIMHTKWAWPIAESLHFVGLTLLVGTVGLFDLRLLGVGRGIPIAAMHRLIRWGLAGFALNAITGSLFGSVLLEEIPRQMSANGVPQQITSQFGSGGSFSTSQLTSVGGDLGQAILSQVPPQFQDAVAPFIDAMVAGIYTAFSIATGAAFVVGIAAVLSAAAVVLVLMPAGKVGEPVSGAVAEGIQEGEAASA